MNLDNELEPPPSPATPWPSPLPPPLIPPPRNRIWLERGQALFEVLLLSGIVSSLLASLPFYLSTTYRSNLLTNVKVIAGYLVLEAGITFLLLLLVMRTRGETLQSLGLRWNRWLANMLIGMAIVPLLFLMNIVVAEVFQVFFPHYFMETNPLTEMIHTLQDLFLFIGAALIAGGIKEELQRAFILRRFQVYLGGAWLGLILWSAAFGLGHYIQGTQGMIAAGLFGLIFGIAYLARGNLIIPIVAHGAYDTLALLGYWFFAAHR